MNGKKAKKIRKKIYENLSLESEQIKKQVMINRGTQKFGFIMGTIVNSGLKSEYLMAKKLYKQGRFKV